MAKGLRATTRKRNKRALREQIFGPAHDARTQRLSAKLQEIAAMEKPQQKARMDLDNQEDQDNQTDVELVQDKDAEEMDVDGQAAKANTSSVPRKGKGSNRIAKKKANRKAKSSIVFPPTARQKQLLSKNRRK